MKKITLAIFATSIIFFSCTTKLYIPNESNVNKPMTATVEEMMQGREIYAANCGKCHKLAKPESRDMMQWSRVLDKMAPKAKLTKEQHDLVLRYLANHNTKK